jgi:hypothetical protein
MGKPWYTPLDRDSIFTQAEVLRFLKYEKDGLDIRLDEQPLWLREAIKWLHEHPEEIPMRQEDVDYFFAHSMEHYLAWSKKKRRFKKGQA